MEDARKNASERFVICSNSSSDSFCLFYQKAQILFVCVPEFILQRGYSQCPFPVLIEQGTEDRRPLYLRFDEAKKVSIGVAFGGRICNENRPNEVKSFIKPAQGRIE